MRAVVPLSGSDSISTVPPSACTDARTIARPSPKPSPSRLPRAVEPVEDALAMLAADAAAGVAQLDRELVPAVRARREHDAARCRCGVPRSRRG